MFGKERNVLEYLIVKLEISISVWGFTTSPYFLMYYQSDNFKI